MIISSIHLKNFMPYCGEHSLTLKPSNSSNVVVVFGSNMGGKTSILNGIRWCLYGKAYLRGGESKPQPLVKLLNAEAMRAADYSIEAGVLFAWEGADYELRRSATAIDSKIAPKTDSDFDVRVSLLKNSTVLGDDARIRTLHECFPEAISRFMLFDGELLQEYEELLEEGSHQGKRIASAIEQALGIPALSQGKEEAAFLKKEFQKKAAKDAEHIKGLEAFAKEARQLDSEIDILEEDIEELRTQEESAKVELEITDTLIAEAEREREGFNKIQALKATQKALADREKEIGVERQGVLRDAWRDLLMPRINVVQQQIEQKLMQHREWRIAEADLQRRRADLSKSLNKDACVACGQSLEKDSKHQITNELARLEYEVSRLSRPDGDEAQLSAQVGRLRQVQHSGASERLWKLEAEQDESNLRLHKIETELADLNEAIRDFDSTADARNRAKRDSLLKHLGGLRTKLEDAEEKRVEKQERRDRIGQKNSGSIPGRYQRMQLAADECEHLEALFKRSLHSLRDALKEDVEKIASEAFLAMTSDKNYTGLRINKQYGLAILDDRGDKVPLRSAGAEQVVALSLIMALNKSRRAGVVVMDTPFGRLDTVHRQNILETLPKLASQVVLLVHEGELTREDAPKYLGNALARSYSIHHPSPLRSEIRPETIGVD